MVGDLCIFSPTVVQFLSTTWWTEKDDGYAPLHDTGGNLCFSTVENKGDNL